MNTKLKLGLAGLAAAALTALALSAPTVASADSTTPPTVGSGAGQTDEALYVLDPESGVPLAQGTSVAYSLAIVGGPSATDPELAYQPPAGGAAQSFTFIAPRGQERDYTKWNAMSSLGSGTAQSLVQINPSGQATVGQGNPAGTAAVATAGGDYSLGVAWLTNNVVLKTAFTYITVVPGDIATTTITFAQPAPAATAPAITTQPGDKTVVPGQSAVFTAAASGSPAPSVTWQSSTDGTTWSDVAGATSDTLTVSGVQLSQSGTKYHAVYTNTAGSVTSTAATLTVTNVVPTEPTGSDAGKVSITDPAEGVSTVTVPAGTAFKAQTLHAWGWSTATDLGVSTADATSGDVVVNIASLAPGAHTVALTQPNSATVVAWGTFTVPTPSYPAKTDTVDLQAAVTASDLWSLNATQTAIDFGNVARNASSKKSLGKVTVIDDRKVLKGWTLGAAWSAFTAGSDEIPASALTVSPKAFDNGSLLSGVTLGSDGTKIAESTAVSTLTDGALLDADLTFTAPKDAKVGQYHSTLTLTLTSK